MNDPDLPVASPSLPRMKVVTKSHLWDLHRETRRHPLNRRLDPALLALLDDEGLSFVWPAMLHEHAAANAVPPHWRCWALLKLTDRKTPVETMLDVPFETFDRWPDLKAVTDLIEQEA